MNEMLRVPPHSMEAEQGVLGGLLLDNSAWDRCGDILTESSFYEHRHRFIWGAISSLINANKTADVLTVFERLQATGKEIDVVYINSLTSSVPSARNIRRYAEIVADRAMSRELILKADEAAALGFDAEIPASEKADKISLMFDRLQSGAVRKKPAKVEELMVEQLDRLDALASGSREPGLPTHIPSLTRALAGGFRPGKVVVLAARPSVGKSSLAASLLLGLARDGHGCLFLSQEMESSEVVDRLTCNIGRIDYERFQQGKLTDDDWSSLSEAAESIRHLPFYVDDQPALSLAEIRAKAMSIRRDGLRVLCVDYLQLCSIEREKGQTEASALADVSKGIKRLAKDLKITVVLLSQLNRDVEKRANPEPTLSDLRDSGAIEQDADVVIFLWKVRQFTDRNIIGLSIPKNRQGKAGIKFGLDFEGQYQRWHESTADISEKRKGDFE